MNYWVLIYRFAWIVVVVLLVIGMICIFLPKCHSYQELLRKKADLDAENARLELSTRQLEQNQQRMQNDPAFVERVAREQGMAKPGETIFRAVGNTNEGVP